MKRLFAVVLLAASVAASAANIGNSGVSGLRTHDHSSAGQGGAAIGAATITGATLAGTTTNSGTVSGGTISGSTLSGTTTNSGTISGGTLSVSSFTSSGSTNGVGNYGTFKNSSNGASAATRLSVGNDASDTALTFDVYGSLHSTNPSKVRILNQSNADLEIGGWGSASLVLGQTSVSTPVTLASTKACATGYNRVGPNFCVRDDASASSTGLVRDTCTAFSSPSAGAKAVLVYVNLAAKSANAAGNIRSTSVSTYTSSGCTTPLGNATWLSNNYEFSAVAAGTTLAQGSGQQVIYNNGLTFYLQMNDDGGNQGTANVVIAGYFD